MSISDRSHDPVPEPSADAAGPDSEIVSDSKTVLAERLFSLLQPVVQERRLYLEDVQVKIAGTRRIVHVIVDLPNGEEGSVSLDVIADLSHALSAALDADPEDDDRPYELEVSSPGVGRPLSELRHWRRALGRIVTVTPVKQEHTGSQTGRLVEVTEAGVTLQPEVQVKKGMKPKLGEPVSFSFDKIRQAKVEVEFHRAEESREANQEGRG
ncbi:ribosome maturation factor RimP [Acaricomes phytoseiuli]|uniref:ribosome maturation factor RimP n=1 Tax=Acaricomes phytoseiuli TaxID=291968 RepID=UPI002221A343|nr:ribosome maturation factor RimP [Acaricomes phytoseiuli]MCW1249826.1 ribosome maturation factor RimP [Acaricomes phytoseiuli]